MFDESEILPILFDIKAENEKLVCRFDCDLFSEQKKRKILILKLIGLPNINEAKIELSAGLKKTVEYWIYNDNEYKKIKFVIDYGLREYKTSFTQYSEKYVKYEDIDFEMKIRILKEWYLNYKKSYHKIYSTHQALLNTIKKFYEKESDILDRKLKFYLKQNSSKADNIRSQILELEKSLKVILNDNTE